MPACKQASSSFTAIPVTIFEYVLQIQARTWIIITNKAYSNVLISFFADVKFVAYPPSMVAAASICASLKYTQNSSRHSMKNTFRRIHDITGVDVVSVHFKSTVRSHVLSHFYDIYGILYFSGLFTKLSRTDRKDCEH